jgi:hypothetical protein
MNAFIIFKMLDNIYKILSIIIIVFRLDIESRISFVAYPKPFLVRCTGGDIE